MDAPGYDRDYAPKAKSGKTTTKATVQRCILAFRSGFDEKGHAMAQQFSAEWAKGVIDDNVQKAQGFMNDPEALDGLLGQLQEKLAGLPDTVGTAFSNVPVMAQMVKCYVTREYTEVSPKVVASLIGAFLYLVARNDLIPDSIPVVGLADDLAIATVAMAINEPELKAFAAWREQQTGAPVNLVTVEGDEAADIESIDVVPIDAEAVDAE